jgi:hypothetical protein
MYIIRSLFVVIPVILYVVNKFTNGLGKKIEELRGEEEILQIYTYQSSAESCGIKTYPAPPCVSIVQYFNMCNIESVANNKKF